MIIISDNDIITNFQQIHITYPEPSHNTISQQYGHIVQKLYKQAISSRVSPSESLPNSTYLPQLIVMHFQ